ncbi:hypothetical protein O1L44_02650 [Streptomyces noursei]|uniref:hypothetical protein n=1 Tax=Streptomyces noursei TaxID=1971 RepID=UPI0013520C60|nr:hypothetical protein [Streptomyces noursei]
MTLRLPFSSRSTPPPALTAHPVGDLGFVNLDDDPDNPVVITGYKAARTKPLTPAKKQVNKLIASVRAVCRHAFTHLKNGTCLPNSAWTCGTLLPSCAFHTDR